MGLPVSGAALRWQKKRRGTPTFGLNPAAFVNFLQNHDQVANSAAGKRCHALDLAGPNCRALTRLTILMPGTPMLFQGDEFASSFGVPVLRRPQSRTGSVGSQGPGGVSRSVSEHASSTGDAGAIADPADPATFERCKLNSVRTRTTCRVYALHRDLIHLRREDPVLRGPVPGDYDGAVLAPKRSASLFWRRTPQIVC